MYTFWFWLMGLFLRRRCAVTLSNGQRVVWLRPKEIAADDYRAVFEGWRSASNHRVKLVSGKTLLTISSDDIVSAEIR